MNDTPTNSQINEAVHKEHTVCGNQHSWTLQYHNKPIGMDHWSCIKCPAYVSVPHRTLPSQAKDIAAPDYVNDPRLWWPFAEEMNMHIIPHDFKDGRLWGVGVNRGGMLGDPSQAWLTDKYRESTAGRAVCLAYLKIKGVEVNG